jgi:hypothetical protein
MENLPTPNERNREIFEQFISAVTVLFAIYLFYEIALKYMT